MFRDKFNYMVQMQRADGEIVERLCSTYWSPDKVTTEEVANAVAAEVTCEHGFAEGHRPIMHHAGLTAVLQV